MQECSKACYQLVSSSCDHRSQYVLILLIITVRYNSFLSSLQIRAHFLKSKLFHQVMEAHFLTYPKFFLRHFNGFRMWPYWIFDSLSTYIRVGPLQSFHFPGIGVIYLRANLSSCTRNRKVLFCEWSLWISVSFKPELSGWHTYTQGQLTFIMKDCCKCPEMSHWLLDFCIT